MSEEASGLDDFLRDLSRSVLDTLDAHLASGALFLSSYDSIEQGVADYVYAIGMSEVHIELREQTIEQWVWRDKGRYINEVMVTCPELAEGIERIARTLLPGVKGDGGEPALTDLVTQRAVDYLSTFVLALTDRLLNGAKEQEEGIIDRAIYEFLRDLCGERSGWDIKVFLKCIWLEEPSCPLAEGIVLRRPRLDDYKDRKWVEGISWGGVRDVDVDMLGTSVGAVLEMRCPPSTEAAAREEFSALMDALLLFRVASLSREHLEMRPHSILTSHTVREEDDGRPPLFHAVLRGSDLEDARVFLATMLPLVHHPYLRSMFVGRDVHTKNMLRIRQRYARTGEGAVAAGEVGQSDENGRTALPGPEDQAFHLYRGALLDMVTAEERLAKLVVGLEYLYLTTGTVVDRKRAVALRASSLLEGWGFDALKVARDIREGFKIKGELYAAGALGMVYKEETLLLCEDLAEYLRASLVVFYQACASLPRDRLIEATDLLVQGKDLPEDVAKVLEGVFLNESVVQPYR